MEALQSPLPNHPSPGDEASETELDEAAASAEIAEEAAAPAELAEKAPPAEQAAAAVPPAELAEAVPPAELADEAVPPAELADEAGPPAELAEAVPPAELADEAVPPAELADEAGPPAELAEAGPLAELAEAGLPAELAEEAARPPAELAAPAQDDAPEVPAPARQPGPRVHSTPLLLKSLEPMDWFKLRLDKNAHRFQVEMDKRTVQHELWDSVHRQMYFSRSFKATGDWKVALAEVHTWMWEKCLLAGLDLGPGFRDQIPGEVPDEVLEGLKDEMSALPPPRVYTKRKG